MQFFPSKKQWNSLRELITDLETAKENPFQKILYHEIQILNQILSRLDEFYFHV